MFTQLFPSRSSLLTSLIVSCFALVLFAGPRLSVADEMTQKEACKSIASTISEVLTKHNQKKLILNGFRGVEAAEGIMRDLREAFAEHDIETTSSGNFYWLFGRCIPMTNDKQLSYKISATLEDQQQNPIKIFNVQAASNRVEETVDDLADSTKATGVSVDNEQTIKDTTTSASTKAKKINSDTIEAYEDQQDNGGDHTAKISGSTIKPSPSSSYAVQLVVLKDGQYQTTKPQMKDGKPVIDCDFGTVLGVKVTNNSREHVVISVAVDGVSSFEFADVADPRNGRLYEAFKRNDLYLVKAGESLLVEGWFKTLDEVYYFEVTDPENSVAHQKSKSVNDCGLFTVQFYPAWEGDQKPDYLSSNRSGGGIKKGDVGAASKKPVTINYEKSVLLATVGVRYDVPIENEGAAGKDDL